MGPLHVRVHQPWRLMGAGLGLAAAAVWLGGAQLRAASARAWNARDRHAGWVAAAAAATAMVVGLVKGTRVAGSADAYGYVSQALLWLKGLPVQAEPLAAAVPWPLAEWSLSPLGYRPGVEPGVIVPTYPPGLPLAMAASAAIGGPGAVYLGRACARRRRRVADVPARAPLRRCGERRGGRAAPGREPRVPLSARSAHE